MIISMYFISSAQTIIPAGNVSGTWTLAGSPYLIQGSIMIPNDSTLTIEPGSTVNFQGTYKLYVQGRLLAIGTITDTITFTATNTTNGWRGIRFDNTPTTNDTSKLIYCKIQYGKSNGTGDDANGGAFFFKYFSKVIIFNCRISNNSASEYGGGIYCSQSNPIIINNAINNNSASEYGGGVVCRSNSHPTITNNIIFNNYAFYFGGGIYCENSYPTITDNAITNNLASSCGGGIHCEQSSPTITNNIISNNSAKTGGGIECFSSSNPLIINNTISYNSATSSVTAQGGGGINCYEASNPIIIGSTISNNSAIQCGGGIKCFNSNPIITNSTISNNLALIGGALYSSGTSNPTFHNCILWGNTANTSGAQVFLNTEDTDPDFYFCDIQDGTAAFGLNGVFYTGIFENNIDVDPLFVDPATGDWSLQTGSPCIDAGTPDTAGLKLPILDIADSARISGDSCIIDIGAYEYQNGTCFNGLEEISSRLYINIFPNPATDEIKIEISQKSDIEILNIEGKIMKTINKTDTRSTTDLKNLSSGVYLIKITTDKGVLIRKIIKQ